MRSRKRRVNELGHVVNLRLHRMTEPCLLWHCGEQLKVTSRSRLFPWRPDETHALHSRNTCEAAARRSPALKLLAVAMLRKRLRCWRPRARASKQHSRLRCASWHDLPTTRALRVVTGHVCRSLLAPPASTQVTGRGRGQPQFGCGMTPVVAAHLATWPHGLACY